MAVALGMSWKSCMKMEFNQHVTLPLPSYWLGVMGRPIVVKLADRLANRTKCNFRVAC